MTPPTPSQRYALYAAVGITAVRGASNVYDLRNQSLWIPDYLTSALGESISWWGLVLQGGALLVGIQLLVFEYREQQTLTGALDVPEASSEVPRLGHAKLRMYGAGVTAYGFLTLWSVWLLMWRGKRVLMQFSDDWQSQPSALEMAGEQRNVLLLTIAAVYAVCLIMGTRYLWKRVQLEGHASRKS